MTKIVATLLTALLLLTMAAKCEETESVLGEVVIPDTGDNADSDATVKTEESAVESTQVIAETESAAEEVSQEAPIVNEAANTEESLTLNTVLQAEPKLKESISEAALPQPDHSKFVLLVIAGGIVIGGLLLLSVYYRGYVSRHRRPPFEAPAVLRCLFPKPINYEHEITVLCSKYLTN